MGQAYIEFDGVKHELSPTLEHWCNSTTSDHQRVMNAAINTAQEVGFSWLLDNYVYKLSEINATLNSRILVRK